MGRGGVGARRLAVGGLVLGKEQLRWRGFGAETAILARGSDGKRRSGRRGAVWVVHSGWVELVGQLGMSGVCM